MRNHENVSCHVLQGYGQFFPPNGEEILHSLAAVFCVSYTRIIKQIAKKTNDPGYASLRMAVRACRTPWFVNTSTSCAHARRYTCVHISRLLPVFRTGGCKYISRYRCMSSRSAFHQCLLQPSRAYRLMKIYIPRALAWIDQRNESGQLVDM